jgi:uncharacterized protein (TIGR00661 family)
MNQPNKGKLPEKPRLSRILVVPLDWGLGHATRCIPLIRELLAMDCEVWLAGEGAQEQLLKTEFPTLPFLQLPGYRVQYAATSGGLLWKMIRQTPKLKNAIHEEQKWLKWAATEHQFDAVISDNRYGLYHSSIPCIFITHQLCIKSQLGNWSERILQKWNYKHINRFTECWVPDLPAGATQTLAGELSHPAKMPSIPVKYIGLLSRFEKKEVPARKDHLLIILSGPEPQRTILEEKITGELKQFTGTATVVRGLPGSVTSIDSTERIKYFDHLPAEELNKEMLSAEYVISRSGYSTVMDIIALQKKCILIPTPGQTEQEYLAKELLAKKIAFTVSQDKFSMIQSIHAAADFSYELPSIRPANLLTDTLRSFVASLG